MKTVDIQQRKCDFCGEKGECKNFGLSEHHVCHGCGEKIRPLVSAVGSSIFLTVPEDACDLVVKIGAGIVNFCVRTKSNGFHLGVEYVPSDLLFLVFSFSMIKSERFEDAVKRFVILLANRRRSLVNAYATSHVATPARALEMAEREGDFWRTFIACFVYQGLLKMEIEL